MKPSSRMLRHLTYSGNDRYVYTSYKRTRISIPIVVSRFSLDAIELWVVLKQRIVLRKAPVSLLLARRDLCTVEYEDVTSNHIRVTCDQLQLRPHSLPRSSPSMLFLMHN